MRVAFIVLEDFPGSETRVQRQVAALLATGHEVRVFAASGESRCDSWRGAVVERSHMRRMKGGGAGRRLFEYVAFCAAALFWSMRRAMRWRPDIVQVANMPDWLVFSAMPFRWLCHSKIVLDLHDPMPELWSAKGGRGPLRRALQLIEGLSIASADVCLVATHPMKRAIERRHSECLCHVVMNSVDESTFHPVTPRVADEGCFVVGYHGTIAQRFGVELVVRAFARLHAEHPKSRLVLIGGGDGLPIVQSLVSELGLGSCVDMLGQRPSVDLPDLISTFSVGLVPYLDSEFMRLAYSTKSMEYAISGVPMLVTQIPGIADLFREDEVLYVPPGSEDEWVRGLDYALRNPRDMIQRAFRAQARVEDYLWSAASSTYLGLLGLAPQSRGAETPLRGATGRQP